MTDTTTLTIDITECDGYKKLLSAVERDELRDSLHNYREKLDWIIERVRHYAGKTGLSAIDILNAWESHRSYWYMNYYQEANQPLIEAENVHVFDTVEAFKESVGAPQFRCPKCKGVSSDPYECNASDDCDWKSYGLFGTLGKGSYVFIKSELRGQEIFTPVAWEREAKAA